MKTLMAALTATLLASPLLAQGWIEPVPGRDPGFAVVKVRTTVSVQVTGRIALVEVEEWFRNDGRGLGEGDYLYPLPGEAVFSNFSLFQGDLELRGETMDADQARAIYEEIVRLKRDPALIELAGHGLVRARVFPINAGETRKITLRYTQIMERAGDALQFRYAAGGRFGRRVTPEQAVVTQHRPEDAPLTFTLVADSGSAYGNPFSPTHALNVSRERGRLTVRPEDELRGDFVVFLPMARGLVGITLVTHKPAGEDGYFMLTLSPGSADGTTLPRDLTVVLDVSGSMSGSKIDQAKAALRQLLGTLDREDRFRLLSFSSGVTAYRADWSEPSGRALRDAHAWIDRLVADGGTNIAGALQEAFRLDSPETRLPIVVFLTDGLPSVGEQNPERIAQQAEQQRGRARVFAFGVGYDVNTYLLDRLSAAGRGATQYVQPGEDVERALSVLAAKIQHPVLTDLALVDAPVELEEIYPGTLPDLFAGEELVVFGRYRTSDRDRSGAITVTGRRNRRTERYATDARFPDHAPGNEFIPRLWASRKIGFLTQQVRLNGANDELIEEIRRTALRYGLLSEYTSYLVQEPEDVAVRRDAPRRGQPVNTPAAEAQSGVGAVVAAEEARMKREAKSAVDLIEMEDAFYARGHMGQARHVAGRLFAERDGVWTDLKHADSVRTVEIAPYGEAYFALLRLAPELEPYFREFGQVLIAGDRVSIRVADGGLETMSTPELARLVRDFRAR
ncbi:MAG: VWA domain-containing protein [Gemmatimonadota bacterium]|nr:MAG: VWA domain-containing protein [Gemmatimonadota bacterium]